MLENNKIYNMDCLNMMQRMDNSCVDLVLTDMPYGTTACNWDKVPDLEKLWIELKRIGKNNCAYVFTSTQPFTTDLINSNRSWFKYDWVWDKHIPRNFINAKIMPMQKHESILVFGIGRIQYNPQMILRDKPVKVKNYARAGSNSAYKLNNDGSDKEYRIYNERNPDTIILGKWEANAGKFHPTQKPVTLFEYLIKTYTNVGNLVFRPIYGKWNYCNCLSKN